MRKLLTALLLLLTALPLLLLRLLIALLLPLLRLLIAPLLRLLNKHRTESKDNRRVVRLDGFFMHIYIINILQWSATVPIAL